MDYNQSLKYENKQLKQKLYNIDIYKCKCGKWIYDNDDIDNIDNTIYCYQYNPYLYCEYCIDEFINCKQSENNVVPETCETSEIYDYCGYFIGRLVNYRSLENGSTPECSLEIKNQRYEMK